VIRSRRLRWAGHVGDEKCAHNLNRKMGKKTGVKSKAVSVTGRGGPWGCETSRFHTFSRQATYESAAL
jgi:hypothetical protein